MDIKTLETKIRSGFDGSLFSFKTTKLGSPLIDRISDDCFPDNTINLKEAKIKEPPDGTNVVVCGTGVDLPFRGMDTEISFYVENGDAAFKLVSEGRPSWKISAAFPPFLNSLTDALDFARSPKPALSLCSHPQPKDKRQGLSFDGRIDLNAMSGGLADLVGRQYQTLSGSVAISQKGSELREIAFTAPVAESVDLIIAKVAEVRFKIGSKINFSPLDRKSFLTPYIELGAEIPFTAKHKIPVAVRILNLDSDIRFSANLTDGIDAVIDELKTLTNGSDFSDLLPSENFHLSDILKLNELFFDFNAKSANKINLIGIGIQSGEPWTIFSFPNSEKSLVAKNIQLSFNIFDPFGAKKKLLRFSGEIALGGAGTIVVSAQYPDFIVQTYLKPGSTLKITEILDAFLGTTAGMPSVEVETFSLSLAKGNYSLNVELDAELSLFDGKILIEEAAFEITHEASQGTRAAIQGTLQIAKIDINLSAKYSNHEWTFQGSTGSGQQIHILSLIGDLAKKFGTVSLPPAISALVIENLDVSFSVKTDDTKTKQFKLTCESKLPVDDKEIDVILEIGIENKGSEYTFHFGGNLKIGSLEFNLGFSHDAESNLFFASYNPAGDKQSIRLKNLVQNISSETANLIPDSLEIELKSILFVFNKTGKDSKFLFGLNIGTGISLSNLPLIGKEFSAEQTVGVDDLQILVASKLVSKTETDSINFQLRQTALRLADLPSKTLARGFNVAAVMKFGSSNFHLSLPDVKSDSDDAALLTAENDPADNVKWFNLQKKFGPVHFERIGVQYQDAVLSFLLDAALSAAGLTLSLQGLSVGSPLNEFAPQFDLRGIGIDYKSGAVEIGGAFLKTHVKEKDGTEYDQYDGMAVLKTVQFSLAAVGSYAQVNGHPSMFIYAVLDYPIGGESYFFITGLAAGFGYNRLLKVPAVDKVADFPLVKLAVSPPAGSPDPKDVLKSLREYIPPSVGDVFFAVGIKFTSFKMIDSFAILTLSFGSRLEINLLGVSTLVVPTTAGGEAITPLAVAQMAFKASFVPAEGFLGVSAQLTAASYILSKDCHLTGGFAFFCWFSGEHTGDFVLSLGGYHPELKKPAHYPQVPPLGLNWRLNENISFKGSIYFALIPSALMAGGVLQAALKYGDFSAWFNAGVHFIIAWQPYHYDAKVHIDVGVSYSCELFGRHQLSFNVGADLHIWGPEFTGKANIDCTVFSFEVTFGKKSAAEPKPISWLDFKKSFLPKKDEDVCTIAVRDGLVSGHREKNNLGVINPTNFLLVTDSVIPSNRVHIENQTIPEKPDWIGRIGIGSMAVKVSDLALTHAISISRLEKSSEGTETNHPVEADFEFTPVLKNVPSGLWGEELSPGINGQQLIKQALSGFEIKPKERPKSGATAAIDPKNLQYAAPEIIAPAFEWRALPKFTPAAFDEAARRRKIADSITAPQTAVFRRQLLQSLGISEEIKLSESAADEFLVAPIIESVG